MPSRLSSLLVRDGLVGVKRMEKAFQRQVIYGGSLDTILLEMNLVPEERLTQYLALASGLPPASKDEGAAIEASARALIDKELSAKYRAVPLALDGEALRILVCAPLEITELEDLADMIDRPLQPLIAPEYRWNLVFATAYGIDPPARFTTLARTLDVDPALSPVGRARTVIVDDAAAAKAARTTNPLPTVAPPPPASPIAPIDEGDATMKVESVHEVVVDVTQPVEAPVPAGRKHSQTIVGLTPNRAKTDRVAVHTPSTGVPSPASDAHAVPSTPSKGPRVSQPIATEGRDAPLPVVKARELLATAEDRDTIFLSLLRAARSRARWAGLLTIQGGAAIGRVAIAEPTLDTSAVSTILIPLDAQSPFRQVVQSHQPYVGPIASGDSALDAMMMRLGGSMPPSALLLPVTLRERVVAIVVAHRVLSDLRLSDVTEILPMATAAADALGRLIAKSKAAGYRAPTEAPVVAIEGELVDTKRVNRASDDPWRTPASDDVSVPMPTASTGPDDHELSITAEPPPSIASLLDTIESSQEGYADDAIAEAVERAPETLGELNRRFPGTLRIDRFSVNGRSMRASQYGGLLELVIGLGSVASELLIEKMGAAQRDVRFYATVCAAELRPRTAVYALAERLFDQDFGVRACAIEALAGYPMSELGHALVRARRALHSNDPEVVGAAAVAVVELGDVEAVGDLIGVIARNDRSGEQARRALVALTAQDFGTSERKWRKWHDTGRKRHRVEWLIEGLSHKEDAIRESAINDLRRLTGEYFGYHHDLPRRERDAAAARWASWWSEAGQRRFTAKEDERYRPTALLPARRDR